jgi:hypothetical protein
MLVEQDLACFASRPSSGDHHHYAGLVTLDVLVCTRYNCGYRQETSALLLLVVGVTAPAKLVPSSLHLFRLFSSYIPTFIFGPTRVTVMSHESANAEFAPLIVGHIDLHKRSKHLTVGCGPALHTSTSPVLLNPPLLVVAA